jgi:hypothetical protein
VPFGMREGNVTTQTLEWLYLDFINEAKIWVKHVYEAFGETRIPLAPAGPIRQAHLHMINWFKGIFYGLFWKIVSARCTYAPDDAIPAIVMWEQRMTKMHINPVISLLVLPPSSSAWSNIFLYITARTACFNTGEVGNLGTDSQALNLAELVCDDWMTIKTELLLSFGSKNWYRCKNELCVLGETYHTYGGRKHGVGPTCLVVLYHHMTRNRNNTLSSIKGGRQNVAAAPHNKQFNHDSTICYKQR